MKPASVSRFTELLRHGTEVAEAPGDWMPWNYRETLAGSDPGPAP